MALASAVMDLNERLEEVEESCDLNSNILDLQKQIKDGKRRIEDLKKEKKDE